MARPQTALMLLEPSIISFMTAAASATVLVWEISNSAATGTCMLSSPISTVRISCAAVLTSLRPFP